MKEKYPKHKHELERGFKSIVSEILGITPRSYSNYKADGRPVIKFFEENFSKYDLEQFLENGSIPSLEKKQLNEKVNKMLIHVENRIFNSLVNFYESDSLPHGWHDDKPYETESYHLIKLILSAAQSPIYHDFLPSLFSLEFREKIELILSYEWGKNNDLTSEECDAEVDYTYNELIKFVMSLDKFSLEYLELFADQLLERWNSFLEDKKKDYEDHLKAQEEIMHESQMLNTEKQAYDNEFCESFVHIEDEDIY